MILIIKIKIANFKAVMTFSKIKLKGKLQMKIYLVINLVRRWGRLNFQRISFIRKPNWYH